MASVGALSARPALGQRVRASTSRVAVRRASVVRPRMGGYESGNAAGLEGITHQLGRREFSRTQNQARGKLAVGYIQRRHSHAAKVRRTPASVETDLIFPRSRAGFG